MKVLYLINFAGKAGTERYVENLVAHLHPDKASCGLCYNVDGPLADKMRAMGIPTHRVQMRHMLDLQAAKALADLCKKEGYDVIHAQYPRENCIALLARHFGSGARVVFTSHLTLHQPLHWKLINRTFTPGNHRIISVCKEGADILRSNGVCPQKIEVIFNGIDATAPLPRDRSVLEEFGIGDGELVISILARFAPEKGLEFLCDAIAQVKAQTKIPFRVLMMGDGELFPRIREQVAGLGLSDTIVLTGFRTDTARLLAASDLYLNSSSCNEAMSFAILEALGASLPVVATDVGGNSDLVHLGGTCGAIIPYGDTQGYAQAIIRLLENDDLRAEYSRTAYHKATHEFDLHQLLDAVYQTYHP